MTQAVSHQTRRQALLKPVLEAERIEHRVRQLADRIEQDYDGQSIVAISLLQGASIFGSDLVRQLKIPVRLDFMQISRYRMRTGSRQVRIERDLASAVCGKHLLLLDVIVETGLTLHFVTRVLKARDPASIAICTLLDRPSLRLAKVPIRYRGLHVKDDFLVGYGLDFRGEHRNLPYIARMQPPRTRS